MVRPPPCRPSPCIGLGRHHLHLRSAYLESSGPDRLPPAHSERRRRLGHPPTPSDRSRSDRLRPHPPTACALTHRPCLVRLLASSLPCNKCSQSSTLYRNSHLHAHPAPIRSHLHHRPPHPVCAYLPAEYQGVVELGGGPAQDRNSLPARMVHHRPRFHPCLAIRYRTGRRVV